MEECNDIELPCYTMPEEVRASVSRVAVCLPLPLLVPASVRLSLCSPVCNVTLKSCTLCLWLVCVSASASENAEHFQTRNALRHLCHFHRMYEIAFAVCKGMKVSRLNLHKFPSPCSLPASQRNEKEKKKCTGPVHVTNPMW